MTTQNIKTRADAEQYPKLNLSWDNPPAESPVEQSAPVTPASDSNQPEQIELPFVAQPQPETRQTPQTNPEPSPEPQTRDQAPAPQQTIETNQKIPENATANEAIPQTKPTPDTPILTESTDDATLPTDSDPQTHPDDDDFSSSDKTHQDDSTQTTQITPEPDQAQLKRQFDEELDAFELQGPKTTKETPAPQPQVVTVSSSGDSVAFLLRHLRTDANLSMQELSAQTHIPTTFIRDMEQQYYEGLPELNICLDRIKKLLTALNTQPEQILARFTEEYKANHIEIEKPALPDFTTKDPIDTKLPNRIFNVSSIIIIVFILALAGIIGYAYYAYRTKRLPQTIPQDLTQLIPPPSHFPLK